MIGLCSHTKGSNFRACNVCVPAIGYSVYIYVIFYYVCADIDEGKFVPRAPVEDIGNMHSSVIAKVFIVSMYI